MNIAGIALGIAFSKLAGLSGTTYSVSRDIPVQKYSVSRDNSVQ
jgi:hypothetical protein